MTTNEPLGSTNHSEPAPPNNLAASEQVGQRFVSADVPVLADPAPQAAVPTFTPPPSTAPAPPPPATNPGAPSGYVPSSYPAQSGASTTGYVPPSAAASAPYPGAYPPPPPPIIPPSMAQSASSATAASSPERVGRGLLYSLGGVVLGVVATAALWQSGFVASITSAIMAWACIWLYTKGAGHPPRKGALAVVGVIIVGVALSAAAVIATDAVDYARSQLTQPSVGDYVGTIVATLTTPEVWIQYGSTIGMLVVFAGLGTVGIIMQLARGNQTS